MSDIIGLNTKLFGLEKNIKQPEPTRAANDLEQLGDPAEKERVLNPIVSESYMQKYIEEHGGGGGGGQTTIIAAEQTFTAEEYEFGYGADLTLTNPLPQSGSIDVVYDGVSYTIPYNNEYRCFGELVFVDDNPMPDFTNYPCIIEAILGEPYTGAITVNDGNSHTIEITATITEITITENGTYDIEGLESAIVDVPEPIPFEKEVYPKQTFTPTLSSGKYIKTLTDASLGSYTNSVIVSYNNTDYTCSVNTSGSEISPIISVGDPDFINYPFYIVQSTSGFPPTATVIAQFADGSQVTLGITTYVITPSGTRQITSNVLTSCSGYEKVKVLVYSSLESVTITRTDNIDASVEFHSALKIDTTYNTVTENASPFISNNTSKTFKVPLISNVTHCFFFTYPTEYTLSVTGSQTSVQTASLTTENVAMVTQVNGWHDMTIALSRR